jgi:hypothetical protein
MEIIFKNTKEMEIYFGKDKYIEICTTPYTFSEDTLYAWFNDYVEYMLSEHKGKEAFSTLQDMTLEEFAAQEDWIDEDSLKGEYIELIADEMKDGDELNEEESDFDFIASQMIDDAIASDVVQDRFYKAIDDVIEQNEQNREFNDSGEDETEGIVLDGKEDSVVDFPEELLKHDDKIGDVVSLQVDSRIDYDTRDYAFIYIDGEIYYNDGDSSLSHSELLVEYLQENGEKDIPQDMLNGEKENSRPSKQRLTRLTGSDDVAFGHVMDGIAYIETLSGSVDAETVAKACEQQLDVEKVYQLDQAQSLVKRLAKNFKYTRMV